MTTEIRSGKMKISVVESVSHSLCRVNYKVNGSMAFTEMPGPALNTWWRLEIRQVRVLEKVSSTSAELESKGVFSTSSK